MNIEEPTNNPGVETVGGKIWHIVDKYYPTGKFTSSEILEKYEDEFNEPIKLSVISTYLARFTSKNKVERAKKGREWAYHTLKLTNPTPKMSEN
jgi:predicted transcriptional regulator